MPVTNGISAIQNPEIPNTARDSIFNLDSGGTFTIQRLGQLIAPHWSKHRDKQLQSWALSNDYFMIVAYNILTKAIAIDFSVLPPDRNSTIDNKIANSLTKHLQQCWQTEVSKFLLDVFTQDNGGFLEVLGGGGETSEPLPPVTIPGTNVLVPAIGLKHWESSLVTRTGVAEYPIRIFFGGKDYLMHHTRVIHYTQMPSPKDGLNGVGFCAVSRCLNALIRSTEEDSILLDSLIDGLVNSIVLAQPFESSEIEHAYSTALSRANNFGHNNKNNAHLPGSSTMRRVTFVGVKNSKEPIKTIEIPLRRLPTDYDKTQAITLTMYLMAASFSADAREVWPATTSGATKADAQEQNKKSGNKFAREFINKMQIELTNKAVPEGFEVLASYTDLDEELTKIQTRSELANTHKVELENQTITSQVAAEQMRNSGFLTDTEFDTVAESLESITSDTEEGQAGSVITMAQISDLFGGQRSINKEGITEMAEYQSLLYEILQDNELSNSEKEETILRITGASILAAFLQGSQKTVASLTLVDYEAIKTQTDIAKERVGNLVRNGGTTAELWAQTVESTAQAAMLFRVDNPLLKWNIDPKKQNCGTCLVYKDVVLTRAEWAAIGIYPRIKGDSLDCGGWRCGCYFTEVPNN